MNKYFNDILCQCLIRFDYKESERERGNERSKEIAISLNSISMMLKEQEPSAFTSNGPVKLANFQCQPFQIRTINENNVANAASAAAATV